MPVSTEQVINRPLAGSELAKIMLADFENMIERDCMLRGQIAYGRVGYEIRYVLQTGNPTMPLSENTRRSKPLASDKIEKSPELGAVSSLPLDDPDAFLTATKVEREIVSPNAARVENGLPITVFTRGENDQVEEKSLRYPKSILENNPNPPVKEIDVTEEVAKELGLSSRIPASAPVEAAPAQPAPADNPVCQCENPAPTKDGYCVECGNYVQP